MKPAYAAQAVPTLATSRLAVRIPAFSLPVGFVPVVAETRALGFAATASGVAATS